MVSGVRTSGLSSAPASALSSYESEHVSMTLLEPPAARVEAPHDFTAFGLPPAITERLRASGIDAPFPIQAAVIPDVLAGRDVCGRAPTGSGKTLAFGLPLVARLVDARPKRPVALVLAPTRELAEQIAVELRPYAAAMGHNVAALYGGVGYGSQRKLLDRGAELVVACPGRLEDLLSMGALRLDRVTTVVVDEADQMSDMGFLPAVRRLVGQTAPERQVLLFSATLDGPVAALVDDFQRAPARHSVGATGPDVTAARHLFWTVEKTRRAAHVADIVRTVGPTVVFCRTRHGADRVATQLSRLGVDADAIHGGRSQAQRDRALGAFKSGDVAALIATDVAARGVHVDGVGAVVHFDPPADAATYLHRSGRTARAGATGTVISLVDHSSTRAARRLQAEAGIAVEVASPDLRQLRDRDDDVDDVDEVDDMSDESSTVGVVKFFNAARGYGFITQPGGADLFVHYTNIAGEGFKSLAEGASVRYRVGAGRRGAEAFDVVAAG
jgi:superfamily II DNA/RNA helicase